MIAVAPTVADGLRRRSRRSRSTCTCRSACRAVRTATSSCCRGRPPAGRATGAASSSTRSPWSSPCGPMASTGPSLRGAPLETVYLGGGTPSLLEPEGVGRLLDVIRDRFGIAPGAEITLEANPGPDERGDARTWRELGFTRISFGAQSLDADRAAAAGQAPLPGRRRGGRRGRASCRDRLDQPRPALRRAGPDRRELGADARGGASRWRRTTSPRTP